MTLDELYERARKREPGAEEELFEFLTERFGFLVRRKLQNADEGHDVVQEALVSVFNNYLTTEIEQSFSAWSRRILENKLIDHFRKAQRLGSRSVEVEQAEIGTQNRPNTEETKRRLLDCLRKVNLLNRRHARILLLKYQGYDFDEICRRMGLTRANAYVVLSRARSMLAKCLNGEEFE